MEADFSGWATKAGLKCSDGRTIMSGAFSHQDQLRVPLVWQHGHTDPENVLGHAILENRPDGVYAYGFFNSSPKAKHAAGLLDHKDISHLSIWANQLVERGGKVMHGFIREVSLVLSGANPGAVIENVTIRHSDGETSIVDDEAVIFTGLEIEHAQPKPDKDEAKHADGEEGGEGESVQDVYDSMSQKQKDVLHFMLGQALETAASEEGSGGGDSAEHGNTNNNDKEGNEKMTRNVFEQNADGTKVDKHVLSHADVQGIVADATKLGSMKAAVEQYALAHGINNIEILFPEATALTQSPEFFKRRTEWVNSVLGGARKSPFSRIKTWVADLTFEAARAKGYIKGTLKKEEFFGVSRRITTPATIYKKQKLDRDDIIDITDFDVVTWMKGEMRIMLDEEIARAILIGDGRDPGDDDKIPEANIRPIATDDEFYTVVVNVNLDDASSSYTEFIEALIRARRHYRGSGRPTMYTTEQVLSELLLIKDTLGRYIYETEAALTTKLRLDGVVTVEVLEDHASVLAVLVNMNDYNIGADKGGQVTLFDDFDIDYNQYKYLIETRISGALVKPKSAMVVKKVGAAVVLVTPQAPTFNPTTGVVTIPTQTGVVYKNDDTNATLTAGAQTALAVGATLNVRAEPSGAGYAFPTTEDDEWSFTRPTI